MTKRPHPGPEPKTHFDQVPVDMVKKIVRRKKAARRSASLAVKPPAGRRQADAGHFHGVQFFKDPDSLCGIVGGFIGEGLGEGTVARLIALRSRGTARGMATKTHEV